MPAKAASRKKASTKPDPRRPGKNGGQLKSGNTGHDGGKGKAGRWTNEFKDFLRSCISDKKGRAELKRVLHNSDHPAYATVLGKALVHTVGLPSPADPDDKGKKPILIAIDV